MGYGNSCHSNTYGRKKRCKSREKDGTIQQFTSGFRQGDYNSGGMRDEIIMFFQIRELLCQLAELYEQVRELYEQVRELCEQVRELCEQVQELCEQVQELCEQVRDLRRKPSAMSGWAGEGNIPAEKPKHHEGNASFARVYIRNFFPEKSIHPFTQSLFPPDSQ